VFSLVFHILFARKQVHCVVQKYPWRQHCFNSVPWMLMFTLLLDTYSTLTEVKTLHYQY
jgi:hypothetical protein